MNAGICCAVMVNSEWMDPCCSFLHMCDCVLDLMQIFLSAELHLNYAYPVLLGVKVACQLAVCFLLVWHFRRFCS